MDAKYLAVNVFPDHVLVIEKKTRKEVWIENIECGQTNWLGDFTEVILTFVNGKPYVNVYDYSEEAGTTKSKHYLVKVLQD